MYVWSSRIARVSKDQPAEVASPPRGQLNREENDFFPCPPSRLGIWSRETGSAVSSHVSLLISVLRLNLVLAYGIPPEFRHSCLQSKNRANFLSPVVCSNKCLEL